MWLVQNRDPGMNRLRCVSRPSAGRRPCGSFGEAVLNRRRFGVLGQERKGEVTTPPSVMAQRCRVRRPRIEGIAMSEMFELFVDGKSATRFRLPARDGTIMAVPKPFDTKAQAVAGTAVLREHARHGINRRPLYGDHWQDAAPGPGCQQPVSLPGPCRPNERRTQPYKDGAPGSLGYKQDNIRSKACVQVRAAVVSSTGTVCCIGTLSF